MGGCICPQIAFGLYSPPMTDPIDDPIPPAPGPLYGALLANVFTILCLLASVWVCGLAAFITWNPYTPLNPFPPATLPPIAVIASPTVTSQFPTFAPTFTHTPQPPAATTVAPSASDTATLQPPTRVGGGETATTDATSSAPTNATNTPIPNLPSATGHIVFVSNRNGDPDIYIMAPGDEADNLLVGDAAVANDAPSLSFDGKKVVFQSDADNDNEIFSINVTGSGLAQLTENNADDANPVWSPDGTKIAFESNRNGNYDIWLMNADGSGATQLTFNAKSDQEPSWSPDGSQLVFQSDRDGTTELYIYEISTKVETRITNNGGNNRNPAWSPDGTRIAYHSDQDGNVEIYIIGPDGTDETRLTDNGASDSNPTWRPNGEQLAFQSDRDGSLDIYIMDVFAGANPTALFSDPAEDRSPSWGQ